MPWRPVGGIMDTFMKISATPGFAIQ